MNTQGTQYIPCILRKPGRLEASADPSARTLTTTLVLACVFLIAALAGIAPARAAEQIESFRSDVLVATDGSLTVTETIVVQAEGRQIKRGIYRDFPTRYLRPWGRVVVPFEVLAVSRNGEAEAFRVETRDGGERVYIGQPDKEIEEGRHHYVLKYRTARQLGFFSSHDELYWNVTGNDWVFQINQVEATVRIPITLSHANGTLEAFTGFGGEKGGDYSARFTDDGDAVFLTTRSLIRGEGLTIVVTWPKGIVTEPSREVRFANWLSDNPEWRAGAVGCLILLLYYLAVWFARGRDPRPGLIIPRYEPPPGISAADARYLTQMRHDQGVFAAGIIGLAVKGWLTIHDNEKHYALSAGAIDEASREKPSNDERVLFDALGIRNALSISVKPSHVERFRKAREAQEKELKIEHLKRHFVTNAPWSIAGLLISGGLIVWAALAGAGFAPASLFLLAWLTGWSFGVYFLLGNAFGTWRKVIRGEWLMTVPALFMTAFSLPFLGAEIYVFGLLFSNSPLLLILIFLLSGINYAFYLWLKAPTRLGRPIYDALDGFRLYLDTAEKDRLELLNPPEETPALFEKYLPYALALGVENRWTERFSAVLAKASAAGGQAPVWYTGNGWKTDRIGNFGQSLGAGLAGALASAATPPGSSSGSSSGGGGGGSSGGGGGGGGGGGW